MRANPFSLIALLLPLVAMGRQEGETVSYRPDGRLQYEVAENGDRIPDFSAAGYGGGGVELPQVAVKVVVPPSGGPDARHIQAALDYVAQLPQDASGIRGAVQLLAGVYRLEASLHIEASGVVLRGAGSGEAGTLLDAVMLDRDPLIQVAGATGPVVASAAIAVSAERVPVGSLKLPVADALSFQPGDIVRVRRPSPLAWIEAVGMDVAPARTPYAWKPDRLDIFWERRVTSVEEGSLILDAPLTTALEARYGGATVAKVEQSGRLGQVGIEQVRMVCRLSSPNPKDEEHPWMAIHMEAVENAWVRDVAGEGFASALVYLGESTRAVTVMDAKSLAPRSELGGYRRIGFFTAGQQNLFVRCEAEAALHAFVAGYLAAGPNVFLECRARQLGGFSGSIGSWASGLLFDGVDVSGGALALDNLEITYGGVGWAAANSVLWQCTASKIVCRSPPGAHNWAIGVWGEFWGDGRWQASNEFVAPQSLYRAQLGERLGPDAARALEPRAIAPVRDEHLTLGALIPRRKGDAPESERAGGMRLENGWLVGAAGIMAGPTRPVAWWRGHLLPSRSGEHSDALTRWLPGRVGPGETTDLPVLAQDMAASGQRVIRHHWGLWYDRRREDHQMVSRMSPMVWPPFFEQPWARSGQGTAWDGLSLYDLERFNPWYFGRLKKFAGQAARHDLVLINEMYFQHNILESGAHWVDFPWRPVNCLQDTGFPEPPPFEGDTIRMAHAFYDLSNPLRWDLHRAYIRQCLDTLEGEPNVIHTLGDEYSGPLAFVQFWLDVIDEWVQERRGRDPLVALSAPKNVQDAILADSRRADLIDVIELKYWWRVGDRLYAPEGGLHLAPRQHLRKWKGGRASGTDLAAMVAEYRGRFPAKAVIYSELHVEHPWAAIAAGASLAPLPKTTAPEILAPGAAYRPSPFIVAGQWSIREDGGSELFYVGDGEGPVVDLRQREGRYRIRPVDMKSGQFLGDGQLLEGGRRYDLEPLVPATNVYWMERGR